MTIVLLDASIALKWVLEEPASDAAEELLENELRRLVLHQLHRFLAAIFPECVTRNIASAYVRMVASDISAAPESTFVCGCDIKSFYDAIQRERVAKLLRQRINVNHVVTLVVRAISTPTVPKSTRRSAYIDFKMARGVPQGLWAAPWDGIPKGRVVDAQPAPHGAISN